VDDLTRPRSGGDIRTLMDKALWARFGETVPTAPHAIHWLSDPPALLRELSGRAASLEAPTDPLTAVCQTECRIASDFAG